MATLLYEHVTHDLPDAVQRVADLQQRELPEIHDEVIQAKVDAINKMHDLVVDDGRVSQAASILYTIMSEFSMDGEDFRPSEDPELMEFLLEVVNRECPGMTDEEYKEVFGYQDGNNRVPGALEDLPLVTREQFGLAA